MQKFSILDKGFSVPSGELGKKLIIRIVYKVAILVVLTKLILCYYIDFGGNVRSHTEEEASCDSEEVCSPD